MRVRESNRALFLLAIVAVVVLVVLWVSFSVTTSVGGWWTELRANARKGSAAELVAVLGPVAVMILWTMVSDITSGLKDIRDELRRIRELMERR